jgi:preflagellin peptidase FlaK
MASVGALLLLVDAVVLGNVGWLDLLLDAVVVVAAYVLWYVRLIAGGADAKAIMALAVLVPAPVAWELPWAELPLWPSPSPAAFVVFANALILFLAFPAWFAVWNVSRGDVAVPAMFLGTRMDLDRAASRPVWIMDQSTPEGAVRRVLFPSRRSKDENAQNVARLRAHGVARVWVTPKVPFMLPLLLGFVAAFTLGDLIFSTVNAVLR